MFLKTFRYWINLVPLGNKFKSLGAATRKDLSPKDFRLDLCMTRRLILFEEDLSWLFGVKRSRRSTIYFGSMPFVALYVRSSILYAISCLIGSQCSWRSSVVICSELRALDTRRAAQFWTYCRLSRTDRCNPYSSALQKKSLEEIKAWTSISASFWDRQFRIFAIFYKWKKSVLQFSQQHVSPSWYENQTLHLYFLHYLRIWCVRALYFGPIGFQIQVQFFFIYWTISVVHLKKSDTSQK